MKLIKQNKTQKKEKKKSEKNCVYLFIVFKEYETIFKITVNKKNWGTSEVMPFPKKISQYEIYANFNVKIRNYALNKL